MNTLHFRYAVEIEKTRSITQAAENLFMAQPNLSKAIKELEGTLGITIFKRTSKGVIPTEQGIKFLNYAKQVLIQIDNMESIHSPDKSHRQKMKISVPRSGYVAKAFNDFTAGFDTSNDIEVFFRETNAIQTISDIREKSYDLGIIRFKTEYEKYFTDYLAEKKLDSQLVWEYEMLAVMPADHPMAKLERIEYDKLAENSVEISQGDESVPYLSPSAIAKTALNSFQNVYVFDRGSLLDLLASVPKSFMLSAPLPGALAERHGLVQRRCLFKGNNFKDLLVYVAGHRLSEAEMQFVNKLFEVRNEVAFVDYT